MSLRSLLEEALTDIATDWVTHETHLSTLDQTTQQLRTDVNAAASSGGAAINDAAVSTSTVYSSSKVTAFVNDLVSTTVAGLLNGAPDALNDLNELAAALGDDANFAATVNNALSVRLRFDAAQTLTSGQQAQGIANLGAVSAAAVGDTSSSLAAVYTNAKS